MNDAGQWFSDGVRRRCLSHTTAFYRRTASAGLAERRLVFYWLGRCSRLPTTVDLLLSTQTRVPKKTHQRLRLALFPSRTFCVLRRCLAMNQSRTLGADSLLSSTTSQVNSACCMQWFQRILGQIRMWVFFASVEVMNWRLRHLLVSHSVVEGHSKWVS